MQNQMLENARKIYLSAIDDLFRRKNVVALGLGYKVTRGERTDRLSLVVSVTQKVAPAQLDPWDLIPQEVSGLSTDVVEVGHVRALMPENPRARYRPALPGVSIGHRDITAGTFGMLVQRDGQDFILSNNHILANTNVCAIGDPIYQPGPADGGTANDLIAELSSYEAIDFGEQPAQCSVVETIAELLNLVARYTGSNHRLQPIQQTPGINLMDAALARPLRRELVIPEVMTIGRPTGIAQPELGQAVQKVGRTTGYTQGIVSQIDVTVDVDYMGRTARFVDQVFTTAMSGPGDSGSGVFDFERRAVGLLFAGSEKITILTPIERVLNQFGVELFKGE